MLLNNSGIKQVMYVWFDLFKTHVSFPDISPTVTPLILRVLLIGLFTRALSIIRYFAGL